MTTSSSLELELVTVEAHRLGYPLAETDARRLAQFVALLSRWSRRIRLTSDAAPAVIVAKHLADGLVLADVLPRRSRALRAVDVGAGGGLPGVICALLRPDITTTFVESNRRKSAFLRAACSELTLPAQVLDVRVEELEQQIAPEGPDEPFDLAWSRATFAPASWLAHAERLLASGGCAAVFTAGPLGQVEGSCRLSAERRWRYELADDTPRTISLLERR